MGALMPIYARVVACQPRKTQHQLEVAQAGHLEGKILCMGTMNTESGWRGGGEGGEGGGDRQR